jgi:hypothetical protein
MNRVEAKWLLLRKLAQYEKCSYGELAVMVGESRHLECRGKSGVEYQLEIECFWDDKPQGDIRVMAAIDDAGWRACFPITYSFLAPPST